MANGWEPTDAIRREANWTKFVLHAGLDSYEELERRASAEPEWFWNALIRFLDIRFSAPYKRVLDLSGGLPFPKWCVDGRTNFVSNALDRHLPRLADKPAVVWEGELGEARDWTYRQLDEEVCRIAGGLVSLGLSQGDVVAIYMPQVPEAVAAFLAIAKIGCIALPLFSGFGKDAIAGRLRDGEAVAIVTAVATSRRGKPVPMKRVLDEALEQAETVEHVIVVGTPSDDVPMRAGRDVWWTKLADAQAPSFATVQVAADEPMLLIFTSGTTGKPKGAVHTHCGITVKAGLDYQLCWDLKESDRFQRFTDFGWFAGPLMLAGSLLAGATLVLAEGAPDFPDGARLWSLLERQRVTFVGLGPTLARSLRAHGESAPGRFDLSALRAVASSGETWDVESWMWVFRTVCRSHIPLMNYCGGTELGGLLCTNVLFPMKPGAFHGPIPGTGADIVDALGKTVGVGEVGELVMRTASIGTTRGLWRDHGRYLESYWQAIPGMWSQGDSAIRDGDGAWYVLGRSDDTIKIAGKRMGPGEIEDCLIASGKVVEAAAVGVPDSIKGNALVCVVVPARGVLPGPELAEALAKAVGIAAGRSFRPSRVLFVSDLPKTRNMKVMRRVVRNVLAGQAPGDLSALVNPEAIDELIAVASA